MEPKNKHILVVEDSPDLQLLISHLLKREGYTVTKAFNGREALERLGEMPQPPAGIFLDLMMPIMDGFAFREAQIKDPRWAGIPVIVMTADAQPEEKADALRVKDFIRKPIDAEALLRIAGRLSA